MRVRISTAELNKAIDNAFVRAAFAVEAEAANLARSRAPIDSGEYRSSFFGRLQPSRRVHRFLNTSGHACFIEQGTRPYTYSPDQNVPMDFGSGVEYRFLGTRRGVRANPIMQESVDRAIRRVL